MRVRNLAVALFSLAWLTDAPGSAAHLSRPSLTREEFTRFSAAVEALRAGDWRAAVEGFRIEAERTPVLSDYAKFFLAESLARSGDLAGARNAAELLVLSESGSRLVPQALLLAASVASQEGNEAQAERFLRRFLSRFPDSSEAALGRYLLGLTLEAQGHHAQAASTFRELWLSAPATAYGAAAGDQLKRLAQKGIVLPALTLEERLERAERLLTGGALTAAREEAESLLLENPGAEQALKALALVAQSLWRLRRFGEAAVAVDRSLALAPRLRHPSLLLNLGRLQYRAGARELAIGSLERLIKRFPGEPETASALVLEGRILEAAGRWTEATGVYQRAAAEFPHHEAAAVALWRLGWIAYLGGETATAGRQFERLANLPVGQPYRLASAYWAGRTREALGAHGEAQRFFRLLLAEAPRSYYGILASRRAGAVRTAPGKPLPLKFPSNPLAPLGADLRFAKAEALRALGLADHANAELEELTLSALADPLKLYALSALWVREEQYHLALRILRRHFADVAWSGSTGVPRRFWEMFYPMSWKQELRHAALRAGLDPYLVAAIVREESNYFPHALSPAGARGLMQLMPQTARSLALRRGLAFGNGELLDEPGPNLELGAEVLSRFLREFGDPRLALAAYNAGPARVREWREARRSEDLEVFVEQIPFDETRHFVKRVLVSWEEYRRIYGGIE